MTKYEFINEALFFPEKKILVIGDLHIGYEHMLQQSGILIPDRQVEDIIGDIKKILKKIQLKKNKVNKVVFIGDIKHFFSYEWKEKSNFNKI
ncbi:MAG: metallophosphoesterase, partial [Candidatus Pacearchaeota archaeon]